MNKYLVYALCLAPAGALTACRSILIAGEGIADVGGLYVSLQDYRGRPDFYREDGQQNLYGVDLEDGSCNWRIDDPAVAFPFFRSNSCEFHPADISEPWFQVLASGDELGADPTFACVDRGSTSYVVHVVSGVASVAALGLAVAGYIIWKRNRNLRIEAACPVCIKRKNDAARVIKAVRDK